MPSHAKVRLVLCDKHEDAFQLASTPVPTLAPPPVRNAIYRAREWLLDRQHPEGCWVGEIEGDASLESEYILLLAWLNPGSEGQALPRQQTPREESWLGNARKAAQRLLHRQLCDGGWSMHPGGPLEISVSVKAYFALKLAGHEPQSDSLQRAREAIMRNGGADAVDGPTRLYLAMLGQIPYSACRIAPSEPIPPVTQVGLRRGIRELFVKHSTAWPALDEPGLPNRSFPLDQSAFRSLTRRLIDLTCQRNGDGPAMQDGMQALESLLIEGEKTLLVQPFRLPVQDTAVSMRALSDAGIEPNESALRDAAVWLMEETTTDCSNLDDLTTTALALTRLASPIPRLHDIPFPGLRLASTEEVDGETEAHNSCFSEQAVSTLDNVERRLRAAQNDDGGWGSHGLSTPDATGRALDALAAIERSRLSLRERTPQGSPHAPQEVGRAAEESLPTDVVGPSAILTRSVRATLDPAVERGVAFLRKSQQPDGSWFGHAGVNYIYGAWQALTGLVSAGLPYDDDAIQAGVNWLLSFQQSCGGWGESPESYADPNLRGQGPVTASQTAWALLGLMAAGLADDPAVLHGVRWLVSSQDDDGAWPELEFTGVEVPGASYVRFDLHRACYPLLALARFAGIR